MNRPLRVVSLVLVALALGMLATALRAPRPGTPLPGGGNFTLTTADGPVSLASLRGQVVLIYFGYASCPDVCPTSLALTTTALRALTPGERAQVRVLFISVDPLRDTPAKLKQYAGYFHPNVTGVTGPASVLGEVATRYGAAFGYTPVSSAAGYVVDHTSVTSLVAPDGRLVEQLPHGTPPPEILAAIRRWLPH